MRQTPVNDYLEEISTELPEELYGNLSDAVYETVCDFDEEVAQLKVENAKMREALAISVPLPLDDDCCAVHPDDVIGYNVGGTDFFGRVKEMHLTRYPKKGQPVLWVVRAVNEEGKEFPHVCWGGRCRAVHKVSAQTYSPEYLETYDENKQLKADNAKLRELAQRMWRLERFGCYGCRQECDAESCYASECKEAIEIEQEMHELGIEV